MTVPELTLTELFSPGPLLLLNAKGRPTAPFACIDLDRVRDGSAEADVHRAAQALGRPHVPLVGTATQPPEGPGVALAEALDLTLVQGEQEESLPRTCVAVRDVAEAVQQLSSATATRPLTVAALCQTLRLTAALPVAQGLVVESMAYSMLLASEEFAEWREKTPRREPPHHVPSVLVNRNAAGLEVLLAHPARRNAYSREMRDGLVEALELVAWDSSIEWVRLAGQGPAFCSGGDLDEFGSVDDVATAHLIRLRQGAGVALEGVRDRVTVQLHGACIGAGVEIPAFAAHVIAAPCTTLRLPELAMGLIPGAGGTVSITRRIGRWRTAWLAISGTSIGPERARAWGLVDEVG